MRKDPRDNTVVEVSLKNHPEYLARIRTIAACLADSAGLDRRESDDAAVALTEACAEAMRNRSADAEGEALGVSFEVGSDSFVAEISDSATACEDRPVETVGLRLMQVLVDDANQAAVACAPRLRVARRARHWGIRPADKGRIAV